MVSYPIRAMAVQMELLRAGSGPKPAAGQNVTVHCTGFGKNGDLAKMFWSTKDPGQKPKSAKEMLSKCVGVGEFRERDPGAAHGGFILKPIGWDEGVLGMQVGEVAQLRVLLTRVSPDYAYSPNGFPAWGIQPNSDLVFEIEVLSAE